MNYIVLYPSLLGGEWFTSSISQCVDDLQDCRSSYEDTIVNVQCYTVFSETAKEKGSIINSKYELDNTKSQIVRDHPVKQLRECYSKLDIKFNPIVLYTKKPDLWWTTRWETLFKSVRTSEINLSWLKENISDSFTQKKWNAVKKQLPDFVSIPDLVAYDRSGEYNTTNMDIHRAEQIRHFKKVFLDVAEYNDVFPEPMYRVNMDNALLGRHELFYKDVKNIFPGVDTNRLGKLLDEWRSRQKI